MVVSSDVLLDGESSPSAVAEFLTNTSVPGLVVGSRRNRSDWAAQQHFDVIDPSYGSVVGTLPQGDADLAKEAADIASEAFESGSWSRMAPQERARVLRRLADRIREDEGEVLAVLESIDTGKPLHVSRVDVGVCASYFEYFAGLADKVLGTSQHLHGGDGFVFREPVGVSAQIIPFNFPMQQVARGVAPALAAGCSVVIKPSPEASLTAAVIANLAVESGVPEGVINVVTGGADIGDALISHRSVSQVTFTGSVQGGIAVTQSAANNVVPTLLELGGKSASVVMGDYTPETVEGVGRMAFYNTGQNCGAGTRLLLDSTIADRFLHDLVGWTRELTIGVALADAYLGPLISERQMKRVQGYLDLARDDGGEFLVGGTSRSPSSEQNGYFVEPAIITGLPRDSRLFFEEVFGPLLCVDVVDTLDEAIDVSNATDYGLAAYIWTKDVSEALRFARNVHAGSVAVNGHGVGAGTELPTGGVKHSGWGREKGPFALENYTYVKSVTLKY